MIAFENITAGTNPETVAELADRSFYVVLHDVAPCFARQISSIADALEPLIGTKLAAAVVPCWHGDPIDDDDVPFVRSIRDRFDDILLHGFTHSRFRGRGVVSLFTGAADEFNSLSIEESELRLSSGQTVLREYFEQPACGFIAPTFQSGRLTAERLARYGLHYLVGFRHVHFNSGRRIPIATWCWDMGRWHALGYAGHCYGNLRMRLYRNLLPCLAIHPVDVDRGFLPLIVDLVRKLLATGRRPIVFGQVPA